MKFSLRGAALWTVCAALLALLAAAPPATLSAQALQRVIYASVVDSNGNPVPNLGPSDFVVREDKVAREVLKVEPATDPMQIAVLVDNSQAADSYVRDYRQGLTAFVTALTADAARKNQVAIITLAERPTINTEYTSNQEQLVKGAQRIFAMSGAASYLLNGIIETSEGMLKRGAMRPVIVAVATDGVEYSDRPYPRVLDALTASGAAFHAVVIGRPVTAPIDLATVLDRGTSTSGGRYDTLLVSTALTDRLKQVASELMQQYRVTYARPNSLIPPEQIAISTPRSGLTARGTPALSDKDRR